MTNQPSINPQFHHYNSNDKLFICFHGFGQNAEVFKSLASMMKDYEFLSIDLPFHNSKNPKLNTDINTILNEINAYIKTKQFTEINLIGYSIGARLAVYIYQHAPQLFTDIYLIAPDGVDSNPLFPVVTHKVVRPIFKFVMRQQKLIHKTVDMFLKFKLISKNQYDFAIKSLKSSTNSEKVANTWIALHKAQFKNKKLFTVVQKNQTNLFLIVGIKDKIITPKKVFTLSKLLDEENTVFFDVNHYQVLLKFFYWLREKKTP